MPSTKKPRGTGYAVAFGCVSLMAIPGVVLTGLGLHDIWRAISSTRWPTAECLVEDPNGPVCTYEVGNFPFSTSTLKVGLEPDFDSADWTMQHLRYPKGGKISVYYDPRDPSQAVMEPGFHPSLLWRPIGGLGFFLPALMAFFLLSDRPGSTAAAVATKLFASVFLLAGLGTFGYGVTIAWLGWSSQRWPVAAATVITGDTGAPITKQTSAEEKRLRGILKGGTIYRYSVAGRVLYEHRWTFATRLSDPPSGGSDPRKMGPANAVSVHYSPSDPQIAVIHPGVQERAWEVPGLGLAILLFGFGVWKMSSVAAS